MPNQVDLILCDEIRRALPKGRILDLPAGDGELSSQLRAQSLQVTPADLFPESFDGVIYQEGIERLENPAAFIRECRRVLRVARRRRLRKQAKRGRKRAESAVLNAELNSQALSRSRFCAAGRSPSTPSGERGRSSWMMGNPLVRKPGW